MHKKIATRLSLLIFWICYVTRDHCYSLETTVMENRLDYKAVAGGVPEVHLHPPFKKKSTFRKKKYNMNKQNFDLYFFEEIYLLNV